MTENVDELKKQAAALNKRIAELEAKGDPDLDAFIEDIKRPGTYMRWGKRDWIINLKGGYRKATKKSVLFSGDWVCFPRSGNPTIINNWSSCGYENAMFRQMLASGEVKVFHAPKDLLCQLKHHGNQFYDAANTMELLKNFIDKTPLELTAEQIRRMKFKAALDAILTKLNGRVFKADSGRQLYTEGHKFDIYEYRVFRVTDFHDGSVHVKVTNISPVTLDYQEHQYINICENLVDHADIRIDPLDTANATDMVNDVKELLKQATPVPYGEYCEMLAAMKKNAEKNAQEFEQAVRKAIVIDE